MVGESRLSDGEVGVVMIEAQREREEEVGCEDVLQQREERRERWKRRDEREKRGRRDGREFK